MAIKAPAQASRLHADASDSEDDLAGAENRRDGAKNKMASKSSKAKRTSMPRSATVAPKRKVAPKAQSRQVLKDRTNLQHGSDTEEVEEFEEEIKPKAKRAKTSIAPRKRPTTTRTTSRREGAAESMSVIPETQPEPEDVEQSIEMDAEEMDISAIPTAKQVRTFVQRARSTSVQPLPSLSNARVDLHQTLHPRPNVRASSVQPLQPRLTARSVSAQPIYPPVRERSGSISDTARERRGGDPDLRRKMSDMTKKYEDLSLKYQNLQEIGQQSAESSFEKLKRASDQKAKDANELIASLKKELAEFRKSSDSVSADLIKLQKQVSTLTEANSNLASESSSLKSSLQVSQNEAKSLEAMLAAARQQMSNPTIQDCKNSGSANTRDLSRSVGSNATDAQKEAKMKENLYSDLTGLIIRGVKRKECEDEYDCIQTGRNGTLHFHLSVANDASVANPKTPSGLSYEEAEFAYEPLLDEGRDRELIDLLPDYLTEEICFPRNHAVKFYTRVVESMTKKIVVED